MDAQELIDEVSLQLNDTDKITWTEAMLIDYINSGQKIIATFRPDAAQTTVSIQLVTGSRQAMPTAARRLLEITRNMGNDGNTPGNVIRAADHESLRLFDASWHANTSVAEIKNYSYNEKTPDIFYVDPPSDGTGYIEMSYSVVPTVITQTTDILDIGDIYKEPLIQWMMFRAYSVEVDSVSSRNRARAHEESFYNIMGRKFIRDVQYTASEEVKAEVGNVNAG